VSGSPAAVPAVPTAATGLGTRSRPGTHASRPFALVIAAVAVVGIAASVALAWIPGPPAAVELHPGVAWAITVAAFLVAERIEIFIETRDDGLSFSLSELAFTVGLFLLSPLAVVAARVSAGAVDLAVRRERRTPAKLAFNVWLFFSETALGMLVAGVVIGQAAVTAPRAWAGVLVAAAAMVVFDFVAIRSAIRSTNPAATAPSFTRVTLVAVTGALTVACLGLVTVLVLATEPAAVALLALPAGLLFRLSRSYLRLAERHEILDRLRAYSSRVAASATLDTSLEAALRDAAEITRATATEIVLVEPSGALAAWLRFDVAAGTVRSLGDGATDTRHALLERVLTDDVDAIATTDALVVPLRLGERRVGAIAAFGRQGEVSAFEDTDAVVLGAIANHAAVAIENAGLIDRLRGESAARELLAHQDPLTGLANRRGFGAELRARAGTSRPFALVIVDLSRFKEVNDTFGHIAGDRVIQVVAERIATLIRADDAAARLGGDEFAVLLADADADVALGWAARAIEAVERPVIHDGVSIVVSASVGIACAPLHGTDEHTLLHHADVALFGAKEDPTRPVRVFDTAAQQATARRHRLALDLRHALEDDDELDLHYQPKASLHSGHVTGVEALLRWRHPALGFVPPDEFIGIAERTGLISRLTDFVLRRGIAQAGAWHRSGLRLGMSLNVSVANLADDALPDRVAALLAEHGVAAGSITLEVTETEIMRDPHRTTEVLNRLDRLGVRLSIDDFGTGHSSLAYLKRIPVREVKIDRVFVSDLSRSHSDLVIARTVIGLAANLSLSCVAEGVEDDATWELLRALGCQEAQGYLLARPMPAPQVEHFLHSRAA
jgi:diguanylate cyclase (GGDEF)-like protein